MNTSRRRAAVIAWSITAAALYGAVGIGAPASAVADDSGRRSDAGAPGDAGSSNGRGPRSHGRDKPDGRPGDTVPDRDDPCPWWPTPKPIPPRVPATVADRGNHSGLIAAAAVAPVIPVPQFSGQAEPEIDFGDLIEDEPVAAPPAAVSPVAAPQAVDYPVPPSLPPRAVPRVLSAPLAPTPAPARVAASPPPAATPSVPQRPVLGSEPQSPVRLGFSDELRNADLAKVIALALPGLAALAGVTALGGAVGYRQARAGYLLRAAGAGRFLR